MTVLPGLLSIPTLLVILVIGTLGGVLDLKIIILHLNTEWSQQQRPPLATKTSNVIFQASSKSQVKCDNCNWTGHIKPSVGPKVADKRVNILNGSKEEKILIPPTPSEQLLILQWSGPMAQSVNQMCGLLTWPQLFMSAPIETISLCTANTTNTETLKHFGNNTVKGVREGEINTISQDLSSKRV